MLHLMCYVVINLLHVTCLAWFYMQDFADLIPGHGGIMDRFDCQILMATFANVYYFTFSRYLAWTLYLVMLGEGLVFYKLPQSVLH